MDQLSKLGRIVRTAIAFATFGIGALILAFLLIPIARRFDGSRVESEIRIQRLIQRSFQAFVSWMERLDLIATTFEGPVPGAAEPVIVVANHPSLIDVVLVVSQMPQADCVVKRAAWSNPFLRGVVSAAGYVPNDGGIDLVDACAQRLAAGRSLLLFPEGTRSPRGSLGPFRRGAAHVALKAGRPLQEVVIRCDLPHLSKELNWWQVPPRTPQYHVTTHAPGKVDRTDAAPSRAAREMTTAMREWFSKELFTGRVVR